VATFSTGGSRSRRRKRKKREIKILGRGQEREVLFLCIGSG